MIQLECVEYGLHMEWFICTSMTLVNQFYLGISSFQHMRLAKLPFTQIGDERNWGRGEEKTASSIDIILLFWESGRGDGRS